MTYPPEGQPPSGPPQPGGQPPYGQPQPGFPGGQFPPGQPQPGFPGGPPGGFGPPPTKNRTPLIIGIVIGLIVLVAGGAGAFLLLGDSESENSAESVTRDFVEASGDLEAQIKLTCAADQKAFEKLSESRKEKIIEDAKDEPQVDITKIDEPKIDGDTATIKVTGKLSKSEDSEEDSATFPLKKEDGDWKICYSNRQNSSDDDE